MNIDWFTFVAQIINFLILVALLRWFLYRPVVSAMQNREEKIRNRLLEADESHQAAEKQRRDYEEQQRQLNAQREGILKEARREAHAQQEHLMKEVREAVESRRRQWLDAFERETKERTTDLRQQQCQMAIMVARQALQELATTDLQQLIVRSFIERLADLNLQLDQELKSRFSEAHQEVIVRSAVPLDEKQRDRLQSLIERRFGYSGEVTFEETRELICGIELDVGGFSFGWNIHEYLRQLESRISDQSKLITGKLTEAIPATPINQ